MYSVLIVDDDKLARKGLIAITDWAKCGMQVVGDVANGKLAMDFLAEHQVEIRALQHARAQPVAQGSQEVPRLLRAAGKGRIGRVTEGAAQVILTEHDQAAGLRRIQPG